MTTPRFTALLAPVALLSLAAAQSDFDATWHDGRAEVSGYELTVTRYGQPRSGQCVMIFVTEPFSESKRVKTDDPSAAPRDTFDALKLNLVRDFQTGIYDYNTMTSVFVRANDFEPVKVTFSSAEWCGHVYEELIVDPRRVRGSLASYFQDESGEIDLAKDPDAILEDNLFILLRGLRGPYLEPGERRSFEYLPSAFVRRLRHRPIEWDRLEIERLATTETIEVPAGSFETMVYMVYTHDRRIGRFHIETAAPHRIVRWQWRWGTVSGEVIERGELSGSKRITYWQQHDNGDEKQLDALGLDPLPKTGS